MDRIVRVNLYGFKGITAEYRLDLATALEGIMGAGKSACMEAVRYALSGEVPTGKKDDFVADYFPPDGGHVVVTDSGGRWIKRGIKVDRRKRKKISRILETSDTAEGAREPDLSAWRHRAVTIDIAKFVGLTPEKRRQFILSLCGSTERAGASLIDQVALQFARDIGGKAATVELLAMDGAEGADRGFDEWDISRLLAWSDESGILETLQAELVGEQTISEAAGKLLDRASKDQHYHRKAALEARAACTELEAAAAAAAPIADQLEALKPRLGTARSLHTAEVEAAARISAADQAISQAGASLETARGVLVATEKRVGGLPELGREPAAPPQSAPKKAADFAAASNRVGELDKLIASFEDLKGRAAVARQGVAEAEKNLANHRAADTGRLVAAWEALCAIPGTPDYHEEYQEMDRAVELISAVWRAGLANYESDIQGTKAESTRLDEEIAASEAPERAARDERKTFLQERERLGAEVSRSEAEYKAKAEEYRTKKAAWKARKSTREEAARALEKARGEVEASEAALEAARTTRSHQGTETPDPDGTEKQVSEIEAKLEEAQTAAGAVQAYGEAVGKARKGEVLEAAWGVALGAIRIARETLIAEATDPIVEDMNQLMPPDCRAFLSLEDERGAPAFSVGMVLEGSRVDVGPLSDGWSTIFLSALSVAICRRSSGRKVLFVEGDHLDEGGLRQAMELLAPCASELDSLILATSRKIPAVSGWTVSDIAKGGRQTVRKEATV
jgi:hypothetical protein